MNKTKIGAGAAIAGVLACTALGLGSGIASADQAVPSSPAMTWKIDHPGRGWDGHHGHDWDGGWDGPGYWDGPQYYGACAWVPPAVSGWVPPAVC
jgi:hypothetical protein